MEVASCRNSVVPGVPVLSNRAVADPLSPTTGGLSRLPHESDPDQGGRGGRGSRVRLIRLLGPAFVAAVAYVDPGNVAANLTAGATFGYLLLWVLVAANAIAVIVQYLSAKLGLVTGRSLPQLLGDRLPRTGRILFWAQAELVVAATDVAEVIGGAIALQILFDLPLLLGGVIVAAVSLGLLAFQSQRSPRTFEFVTMGLLAIVALGFVAGLFVSPVDWGGRPGPRARLRRPRERAAGRQHAWGHRHAACGLSALLTRPGTPSCATRREWRQTRGEQQQRHVRSPLAARDQVGCFAVARGGGLGEHRPASDRGREPGRGGRHRQHRGASAAIRGSLGPPSASPSASGCSRRDWLLPRLAATPARRSWAGCYAFMFQ